VLKEVERVRIERASIIQGYSREKALGAPKGEDGIVRLNASEYAGYNFGYDGARKWAERMEKEEVKGSEGGEERVEGVGRGVRRLELGGGVQAVGVVV